MLTLAAVSTILAKGAAYYQDYGSGRSRGTLSVQLAGNIRRGGLVEIPFGASLRELVEGFGGGTASGRPLQAIQVGGPLGAYLPESQWIRRWITRHSMSRSDARSRRSRGF